MIAPYIIEELERDRRRSEWQPQPLFIEAPRHYPPSDDDPRKRDQEPETERVIIIDYNQNAFQGAF